MIQKTLDLRLKMIQGLDWPENDVIDVSLREKLPKILNGNGAKDARLRFKSCKIITLGLK